MQGTEGDDRTSSDGLGSAFGGGIVLVKIENKQRRKMNGRNKRKKPRNAYRNGGVG